MTTSILYVIRESFFTFVFSTCVLMLTFTFKFKLSLFQRDGVQTRKHGIVPSFGCTGTEILTQLTSLPVT